MANAVQIRNGVGRALGALGRVYPAGGGVAGVAAAAAAVAGLDPAAAAGLVVLGSALEQAGVALVKLFRGRRRAKKAAA